MKLAFARNYCSHLIPKRCVYKYFIRIAEGKIILEIYLGCKYNFTSHNVKVLYRKNVYNESYFGYAKYAQFVYVFIFQYVLYVIYFEMEEMLVSDIFLRVDFFQIFYLILVDAIR